MQTSTAPAEGSPAVQTGSRFLHGLTLGDMESRALGSIGVVDRNRVQVGTGLIVALDAIRWAGLATWILTVTWFTWPYAADVLSFFFTPWRLLQGTLTAVTYPTTWAALLLAAAASLVKAGMDTPSRTRRWLFLVPVVVVLATAAMPMRWLPSTFAIYLALVLYLAVSLAVLSFAVLAAGGLANRLVGTLGVVAGAGGVCIIVWLALWHVDLVRASHAARTFTTPERVISGLRLARDAEHAVVSTEGRIVDTRPGCPPAASYCTTLARRRDMALFVASTGIPREFWESRQLPDGSRGLVSLVGELLIIAIEGPSSVGVTIMSTVDAPAQIAVRWGE
jgi:hypothetical protein